MNFNRKWKLVYFAAAVALLVALASSADGLADDRSCTGMLGAIGVDNLRVPQNATCTLNGTRVNGNIFVETSATLLAYNVEVDGNIQADNAARVNVYAGSSVGGNLQIVHSGSADIESVDIDNNLYFDDNDQFIRTVGNTIGGDVQAFNNTGGIDITGNTIANNLQCKGNIPPPTGAGNVVGGNMEDQCANFGGDLDPAPTNPPPVATNTPTVSVTAPSLPTSTPTVSVGTPSAPTSTPTVPINDLVAPTVRWIAPASEGGRYDLSEGEAIFLEVEAIDNVSVRQVRFLWWDAANEQYVTLGTLVQPPYRLQVSASTLNPEWNQIFAIASDLASNNSDYPYIWLYKLIEGGVGYQIFLPFTGK